MNAKVLPVVPLAPDPIRPDVGREAVAMRLTIDPVGPEDSPKIGLVTLGCDKNTVDSEKMLAALVGHGARVSSDLKGSDVVVVNTCGFIEAAKEQSIETILEACRLKEKGRIRAVVAVGCMVQRYKDELRSEIPEVDLFLGLDEMTSLVPALREGGFLPELEEFVSVMERPMRILATETPHTSFLKISEGCDHTCSFCAIPSFRGRHRSAPLPELVAEAKALAQQGVKELNIISQDTTWYGKDVKRRDSAAALLPDLLRTLLCETEVPWFRLFYMYPSGITHELVDLMVTEDSLLPYLDMPIQHGSDRVLRAMRRPERQGLIRERVAYLRDAVPGLTLRTTVIVGFPGETEDDFCELLNFLEEIRFDRVGAFTYSVEEGTPAAEMPDQLPASLMRERLERLIDVQREISVERNAEFVGRRVVALVDEIVDNPGPLGENDMASRSVGVARTESQAIDVDGVTHVHPHEGLAPGEFITVEIEDSQDYDLIGRVVEAS